MKNLALLFALACTCALHAAPPAFSPYLKTDQFGYRPGDPKVAIIAQPRVGAGAPGAYTPAPSLEVRRWDNDAVVYSGNIQAWNGGATHAQSGDKVWWFDFSALAASGDYYVYDPVGQLGSYPFRIAEDVYVPVLRAAVKAFFYQRCGSAIEPATGGHWTHPACHTGAGQDPDCRLVTAPAAANALDLNGGWHDAGDYNKYVNFTYATLHNLLFAYQENPAVFADDTGIPESGNGVPDLLDEVKYELDWLLRMQRPDGSVLSKVSVTGFQAGSPPNTDHAPRYYSPASTSATLTVASVFAHAYLVLKDVPALGAFADLLRTRAGLAWAWASANPAAVGNNGGFQSAEPEVSEYDRLARKTGAAALLYAATGNSTYKSFFESNYGAIHPYQWSYFYTFEGTYGDILLFYTTLPGISAQVGANILSHFTNSTNSAGDFFPAVTAKQDAYRAYLKDDDYVWGSNQIKALSGQLFESMIRYHQSPANQAAYRQAAQDYLHYLHGVNAPGIVMLSNVKDIGADSCATQIYHGWTGDGTAWDLDPVPGLLTGGVNKNYSGVNGYFATQPVQKKYLDWNSSWPENSWEITEPAIYYQAAYVRLLSKYAPPVLPVSTQEAAIQAATPAFTVFPNPAHGGFTVRLDDPVRPADNGRLDLFDALGRQVSTQSIGGAAPVTFQNMPAGVYYLRLCAANGMVFGTRLVEILP